MGRIWKLDECANKYCSFIPHDLGFFYGRFQCVSMADDWVAPRAELLGRSKPLGDFVSWIGRAPVVSKRARDLIEDLVADDVEFLRFHTLKGKPHFVMNVLRCEDYLDIEKSDLTVCGERFIFRSDLPKVLPPIFKCPERWGEIFVSSAFAQMMVTNKLRGAALADPGEPTFPLVLANADVNRYPGLLP